MQEKVFEKNTVVFREGDLGNTFYQICKGTAGIYLHYGEADQRKLTDMKPGQYFGELSIIEAWPRSATVVAEDELHAIELTAADLNDFFKEQPDRILKLFNQIGDRIRELTAAYNDVQAFIKEKKEAGAEKKEGFFARLKKYREDSALSSKLIGCTVEGTLQASEPSLQVKSFNKNQIIFREGDEGTFMFQIHGGSVSIYSNYGQPGETKLTQLYTNDFFGEMGILGETARSATAVVAEPGTMLEFIRAEDLTTLFETNPMKVNMILAHLSNRLRRLTADYVKACAEAAADA